MRMTPYVPLQSIAIRDSIDDNISDDVDDDVFIKDAKAAKLLEDEDGAKRPLMAARRKNCNTRTKRISILKKHRYCYWRFCEPFCYTLALLTIATAIVSLIILIFTMFPFSMQKLKYWLYANNMEMASLKLNKSQQQIHPTNDDDKRKVVPCTQINVQKIWSVVIPRRNSKSPIRKADLNRDNIADIIFGFGLDDNIQNEDMPMVKCHSPNLGEEVPCEGGVIAINGNNGELLWQSWSVANVFSLLCNLDINDDGYPDCVAAGRFGMIFTINGRNGNSIWEFHEIEIETNSPIIMDLYTINLVRDLDGDNIPEILAAHLEERDDSKAGHIKIISGKTGQVIRTIPTPYREEVFVPIQIITAQDGTELLMIITGGQNTPGGIYTLRLLSLMKFTSEKEFTTLYHRKQSGAMVPAIITDITSDGIADVVVAFFNSTIFAFDGKNFSMLWNYSFPTSDSISAIVPGHFNYDNVTDFMVKYNTGPGFPVYYYSQTTILDGRNGHPLLKTMMTDSGGANSLLGGVSISQTFGGDFFLHWQMQCRDNYDRKDAYEFVPDSDLILQARADTCRLRYNASSVLKLYAIARHIEPPGAVIFSTDDLDIRLNQTKNLQWSSLASEKKKLQASSVKYPKLLKHQIANEKLDKVAIAKHLENGKFTEDEYPASRIRSQEKVLEEILPKSRLPDYMYNHNEIRNHKSHNRKMPHPEFDNNYNVEPVEFSDDYEDAYQGMEIPQTSIPNDRPIHLRSKYPGNRDVRDSKMNLINETLIQVINSTFMPKTLPKERPLTLWDLEREKEQIYIDDPIHITTEGLHNNLHKREGESKMGHDDQWYLPSISSMGVLLKSLNDTKSSIDLVFILNVRESEVYPPLFISQDLACVEEKMSAYKSYTLDNQQILRKQFLKQCLGARYLNVGSKQTIYESQVVITRISLTCTCSNLQNSTTCSQLDDIENQKWTQYMGNTCNGYYNY